MITLLVSGLGALEVFAAVGTGEGLAVGVLVAVLLPVGELHELNVARIARKMLRRLITAR